MDDFNSQSWGYDDLDHKGDEVEDWTITHNMVLINKADGSAENTTRNGGCGIYIRQPTKPLITITLPHRDRDCHPAGDKTKDGCAPLYLYCNHSHQELQKTTPYTI